MPSLSEQLLREWNDTAVDYGSPGCLHQLIEAQVDRTPEAVAVICDGRSLTYGALDRRANRLAHRLLRLGMEPDSPVGICAERSLELMVGLLAILKAGGAYVPLDPEYPRDRLVYMIEDALGGLATPLLLTQGRLLDALPATSARIVLLEEEGDEPEVRPAVPVDLDQVSYLIYTSGSTGRPKGVMNSHRGIVNRLLWMQETYRLDSSDRVLQKTPASFDVSVWEFFWPLLTGARLVMALPGGHRDPAYLARVIAEEGVTTAHFVPSMLSLFLEAPEAERCGRCDASSAAARPSPTTCSSASTPGWPARCTTCTAPPRRRWTSPSGPAGATADRRWCRSAGRWRTPASTCWTRPSTRCRSPTPASSTSAVSSSLAATGAVPT